jgi:hypothetical protein
MNNFLKVLIVKSVLSVHALIVFKFLDCLGHAKNMYKISACFFVTKHLPGTNSKKLLCKLDNNFCTGFPLCHWLIFSGVQLSLDAGKIRVNVNVLGGLRYDISGPQEGFCMLQQAL